MVPPDFTTGEDSNLIMSKVSTNGRGVTWDVFNVGDDDHPKLEIQRIDEVSAFESDDDALTQVIGLAMAGDKEAQEALKEVGVVLRRLSRKDK